MPDWNLGDDLYFTRAPLGGIWHEKVYELRSDKDTGEVRVINQYGDMQQCHHSPEEAREYLRQRSEDKFREAKEFYAREIKLIEGYEVHEWADREKGLI